MVGLQRKVCKSWSKFPCAHASGASGGLVVRINIYIYTNIQSHIPRNAVVWARPRNKKTILSLCTCVYHM